MVARCFSQNKYGYPHTYLHINLLAWYYLPSCFNFTYARICVIRFLCNRDYFFFNCFDLRKKYLNMAKCFIRPDVYGILVLYIWFIIPFCNRSIISRSIQDTITFSLYRNNRIAMKKRDFRNRNSPSIEHSLVGAFFISLLWFPILY